MKSYKITNFSPNIYNTKKSQKPVQGYSSNLYQSPNFHSNIQNMTKKEEALNSRYHTFRTGGDMEMKKTGTGFAADSKGFASGSILKSNRAAGPNIIQHRKSKSSVEADLLGNLNNEPKIGSSLNNLKSIKSPPKKTFGTNSMGPTDFQGDIPRSRTDVRLPRIDSGSKKPLPFSTGESFPKGYNNININLSINNLNIIQKADDPIDLIYNQVQQQQHQTQNSQNDSRVKSRTVSEDPRKANVSVVRKTNSREFHSNTNNGTSTSNPLATNTISSNAVSSGQTKYNNMFGTTSTAGKSGTMQTNEQAAKQQANELQNNPTNGNHPFDKMGYEVDKKIQIKVQKRLSDAGNILPPNGIDFSSLLFDKKTAESVKNESKTPNTGNIFGAKKPPQKSQEQLTNIATSTVYRGESEQRLITNFAFKSRPGALPGKPVKTNQDAYIINSNFCGSKDKYYYSVCDGHGVNGHLVSNFLKQHLPKNFEQAIKPSYESDEKSLKTAIQTGFSKTCNELLHGSTIDCTFSGSTCVSVFIFGNKLWTANIGDSRAILAKQKNGNEWKAVPLTRDQKPDDKLEMERILNKGGRVECFKDYNGDPVGPARVWLKNENIPGLAMARSIGDLVAQQAGVISDPEFMQFDLTEEDRFLIVASDGVWEFLSNEEVMNIVVPFFQKNNPEGACDKLVKESVICWKKEDEVIDDITCIIAFLKVQKGE